MKSPKVLATAIAAVMAATGGASALGKTHSLDSLPQCSDPSVGGDAQSGTNGISIGDVTGNVGGATDCWGTDNGNDSQLTGTETDGSSIFSIGTMNYSFVSKVDINTSKDADGNDIYDDQTVTGLDIGLKVGDSNGSASTTGLPATSGTWEITKSLFDDYGYGDFLVSLKAAKSPGYAVWLFSGTDADSTSGTWEVAWNKDLSHLSIYAKKGSTTPITGVIPLPAAGLLLITVFGGLAALARRRQAA